MFLKAANLNPIRKITAYGQNKRQQSWGNGHHILESAVLPWGGLVPIMHRLRELRETSSRGSQAHGVQRNRPRERFRAFLSIGTTVRTIWLLSRRKISYKKEYDRISFLPPSRKPSCVHVRSKILYFLGCFQNNNGSQREEREKESSDNLKWQREDRLPIIHRYRRKTHDNWTHGSIDKISR